MTGSRVLQFIHSGNCSRSIGQRLGHGSYDLQLRPRSPQRPGSRRSEPRYAPRVCASDPEKHSGDAAQRRFQRLYEFLKSGKLHVKVLPSDKFGLIHGKAGVITAADGTSTSFLGSINETYAAWKLNYELLWRTRRRGGEMGPGRIRCVVE
jgi:hypothetical protein